MATSCAVCAKVIKETSARVKGEDAVFCEGPCQSWIHRQCIGMSLPFFQALTKSKAPFHCLYCSHTTITELKNSVSRLEAKLSSLQQDNPLPKSTSSTSALPINKSSGGEVLNNTSTPPLPYESAAKPTNKPINKVPSNDERKFNIIVFGLEESPTATSRHVRQQQDLQKIESVFTSLSCYDSCQSIKDYFRLGKYNSNSPRPRPVKVALNRVSDVRLILSKKSMLPKPLAIKPDLPPQQRLCENTLMQQRWSLIQSGVTSSDIKINRPKLFVKGLLHGTASGSVYTPITSPTSILPTKENSAQKDDTHPPTSDASHSSD